VTVILCAVLTAILVAVRAVHSSLAPLAHAYTYKVASIDVLPGSISVPAGGSTHYAITVPGDASHAHLDGEFTVEPRPDAQVDMLVVTEAGMRHWKDFISKDGSEQNSSNRELIYHTGKTRADLFHLMLAPGTYYLIFDDGPEGEAGGYYTEPVGGGLIRSVSARVTLSYERANPGIPSKVLHFK
jgi:hypothetical protein